MITRKTKLSTVLKIGEECEKCSHCCSHGSGFLVGEDVKKIARFLKISEEELKKKYLEEITLFNTTLFRPKLKKDGKPYGKCVFLGKDCKIHKVKPLQCKIGNCKEEGEELSLWFMLNYQLNDKDPESIRQYAVYLKAGGKTLEGGKLDEICKDKGKLKKILGYEVLK